MDAGFEFRQIHKEIGLDRQKHKAAIAVIGGHGTAAH
jgi:hypothetical protein